jgi:hypothetical protein
MDRQVLIVPDAQLEYYAEVYLAMPRLRRGGVTFERFLRATPQVREDSTRLMQLAVRERWEGMTRELAVLTGRSRVNQDELERVSLDCAARVAALEAIGCRCSDGRLVEKLRHHRFPRSRRDFVKES